MVKSTKEVKELCASNRVIQFKFISAVEKLCASVNGYPRIEYTVQRRAACDI